MSKKLYVAYGSNLNIAQMRYRCPTATLCGTGTLENYELQFKGFSNSAFATISQKEGSSVPIAVWEINPSDEKSLDRYEGYPNHYYKEDVSVKIGDSEVDAMVYIMNPKMRFGLPSITYYDTVMQGYKDCGLDKTFLETALKESTQAYYNFAVEQSQQISLYDFNDEDEDEFEEEQEIDESNINDPFYFSDDLKM